MMPQQHLSDEAVAAFADGVLTGHARTRAARHTGECHECAEAVRDQREAVLVLRDAPAPPLPLDLLDRLRGLPEVTPIATPATVVMPDGSTMLSTAGVPGAVAAFVPPVPTGRAPSRLRPGPFSTSLAAVVLAGALTAGASGTASRDTATDTGASSDAVYPAPAPGTGPMTAMFTAADVPRPGDR